MRVLAIVFAAVCAVSTLAIADDSRKDERAWSELSEARAVLLLRHTSAPGIGDPPGFVLDECATQRNLNDAGKGEARRWGELLRRKGIVQPRLLSSRWCRSLETGAGMGLTKVEPFPLLDSFFVDSKRNAIQTDELRVFLNEHPSSAPVVLITHQVNVTALTGFFPRSGEGLILEFPITDPVTVLARIPPP